MITIDKDEPNWGVERFRQIIVTAMIEEDIIPSYIRMTQEQKRAIDHVLALGADKAYGTKVVVTS